MKAIRQWLIDGRPRLGAAVIALAVISIAMLLYEGARPPSAGGPPPMPHFDKVLHFGAHGWVAGLLFWGGMFTGRPAEPRRRALLWALSVLIIDGLAGLAVELVQLYIGAEFGRQFDWYDLWANLAGAITAIVPSTLFMRWIPRPTNPLLT